MPKPILPPELAAELSPATLLVRGGSERSAYDETAEALFMTSGFVYGRAAEAEAARRVRGADDGQQKTPVPRGPGFLQTPRPFSAFFNVGRKPVGSNHHERPLGTPPVWVLSSSRTP